VQVQQNAVMGKVGCFAHELVANDLKPDARIEAEDGGPRVRPHMIGVALVSDLDAGPQE
jgi:hypothetical protein